jgi:hypothetical protein
MATTAAAVRAPVAFAAWVEATTPQLAPPVGTQALLMLFVAFVYWRLSVSACVRVGKGACLKRHGCGAWCKGNRMLYEGALKVMIVGGPNERRDFHIEDGEVRLCLCVCPYVPVCVCLGLCAHACLSPPLSLWTLSLSPSLSLCGCAVHAVRASRSSFIS